MPPPPLPPKESPIAPSPPSSPDGEKDACDSLVAAFDDMSFSQDIFEFCSRLRHRHRSFQLRPMPPQHLRSSARAGFLRCAIREEPLEPRPSTQNVTLPSIHELVENLGLRRRRPPNTALVPGLSPPVESSAWSGHEITPLPLPYANDHEPSELPPLREVAEITSTTKGRRRPEKSVMFDTAKPSLPCAGFSLSDHSTATSAGTRFQKPDWLPPRPEFVELNLPPYNGVVMPESAEVPPPPKPGILVAENAGDGPSEKEMLEMYRRYAIRLGKMPVRD